MEYLVVLLFGVSALCLCQGCQTQFHLGVHISSTVPHTRAGCNYETV